MTQIGIVAALRLLMSVGITFAVSTTVPASMSRAIIGVVVLSVAISM